MTTPTACECRPAPFWQPGPMCEYCRVGVRKILAEQGYPVDRELTTEDVAAFFGEGKVPEWFRRGGKGSP